MIGCAWSAFLNSPEDNLKRMLHSLIITPCRGLLQTFITDAVGVSDVQVEEIAGEGLQLHAVHMHHIHNL